MRNEKMVREIAFGKGTARITVEISEEVKHVDGFEGIDLGTKIIESVTVELVDSNGKVLEESNEAEVVGYDASTYKVFMANGLSPRDKMSKIGNAMTIGEDAGIAITEAIKEMKEESAATLEIKTNKQIEIEREEKETIENAKEVIEIAERNGVEKLQTADELKRWRINYNNVVNEGGEGYIPARVSLENYENALKVMVDK